MEIPLAGGPAQPSRHHKKNSKKQDYHFHISPFEHNFTASTVNSRVYAINWPASCATQLHAPPLPPPVLLTPPSRPAPSSAQTHY